ncbi:MAG: DUF3098 domain-containing protein [Bacteroidia bacterium]|nr:DUF3098 domain-containing protein [Bacteroidia bacterium]NNJ54633.1 DUF3098 domain-containing protein [Bacteroidia bacterium]
MSKSKKSPKVEAESKTPQHGFVFAKENYMLMIIGIVVIVLGFFLMYGKENIYDFRKITLAPIVVIAGFIIEIFAIMKKPKAS